MCQCIRSKRLNFACGLLDKIQFNMRRSKMCCWHCWHSSLSLFVVVVVVVDCCIQCSNMDSIHNQLINVLVDCWGFWCNGVIQKRENKWLTQLLIAEKWLIVVWSQSMHLLIVDIRGCIYVRMVYSVKWGNSYLANQLKVD